MAAIHEGANATVASRAAGKATKPSERKDGRPKTARLPTPLSTWWGPAQSTKRPRPACPVTPSHKPIRPRGAPRITPPEVGGRNNQVRGSPSSVRSPKQGSPIAQIVKSGTKRSGFVWGRLVSAPLTFAREREPSPEGIEHSGRKSPCRPGSRWTLHLPPAQSRKMKPPLRHGRSRSWPATRTCSRRSATCTSVRRRSRARSGCWNPPESPKIVETFWRRRIAF